MSIPRTRIGLPFLIQLGRVGSSGDREFRRPAGRGRFTAASSSLTVQTVDLAVGDSFAGSGIPLSGRPLTGFRTTSEGLELVSPHVAISRPIAVVECAGRIAMRKNSDACPRLVLVPRLVLRLVPVVGPQRCLGVGCWAPVSRPAFDAADYAFRLGSRLRLRQSRRSIRSRAANLEL